MEKGRNVLSPALFMKFPSLDHVVLSKLIYKMKLTSGMVLNDCLY